MKPSYATITVEETIECPTDLARDSRSYAFSDFYIEKAFLGPSYFREVKKIFRDAYTELIGDGVYISCYKYFNPESHGLDNELVLGKSGKIARLIGARLRK